MTVQRVLLACLLLAGAWVVAQGPINDQVTVEFNNPVMIGDTTLPAGKYHIRQMPTANNPKLFEFVSENNGTEATASATPIVDNLARHPTSVILAQKGANYYVSRMWIAGEPYGYEFTPAEGGREMEIGAQTRDTREIRMTGTYTPGAQTAQNTPGAAQQADQERQRQEQERAAAEKAEQERAAAAQAEQDRQRREQERAAAEKAEQDRLRQEQERAAAQQAEQERLRREQEQTQIAQNRPQAQEQPPSPPAQTQQPARDAAPMPDTALGWPGMILGGLLMIGSGAIARRFGR
jgi:hypothetical protein